MAVLLNKYLLLWLLDVDAERLKTWQLSKEGSLSPGKDKLVRATFSTARLTHGRRYASTYLKRWACWARGPGYLLFGDWYSWERMAWFVFWLGLLANFTVIGSVAPGGFCPFKPLIASSASIRLSNRMKPTPLETPAKKEKTSCSFTAHFRDFYNLIPTFKTKRNQNETQAKHKIPLCM